MNSASLAAEWTSVVITGLGLGSLILQVGAFQELLDPFHDRRGPKYLGAWASHGADSGLWAPFRKNPPKGPVIEGKYSEGFCKLQHIHVSRKPLGEIGAASWTALLAVFHPNSQIRSPKLCSDRPATKDGFKDGVEIVPMERVLTAAPPEKSWRARLPMEKLEKHRDKACTTMKRTAFITCLVLANAYQIYKHTGPAGLRLAYSGYTGIWQVQWPLGGSAELEFFPLDSHDGDQENHPISFVRRVDKCILMLLGIIERNPSDKLAFPEPHLEGCSILEFHPKGFMAHGKSTHLLNMMGGNCYDVDCLLRRIVREGRPKPEGMLELMIPTPELDLNRKQVKPWDKLQRSSTVYVPYREQVILAKALDCLPWSPLGWSIHRGMQSLLAAYGERVMQAYRPALAQTLKQAIKTYATELEAAGWNPKIVRDYVVENAATSVMADSGDGGDGGDGGDTVRNYMAENAATSVMADGGDSGDTVRIVTAAAQLLWKETDEELDETHFWRDQVGKPPPTTLPASTILHPNTVIALTKLFVLQWSNELDHKLYEDLPLFMLVA